MDRSEITERVHTRKRANACDRGYNYAWQKARAMFLAKHPLCAICLKAGRVESASVVDHIIPHKGDPVLFWDENNWQSLSKACHDSEKKRLEHGSMKTACDVNGQPSSPDHHWNRS